MPDLARRLFALHQSHPRSFDRTLVSPWAQTYLSLLFPHWAPERQTEGSLEARLQELEALSRKLMGACDTFEGRAGPVPCQLGRVLEKLPEIQSWLLEDARSMLDGDPAARSLDEVILSYPGFFAIAIHRVAHELFHQGLTLFARLIAEHAHSVTGIDIHPGARIGRSFFIDHGTGVVIGETTLIGNHVKIYQGVTLGALSVSKEMQDQKRHPTIEDDCVIYANASILGGETVVGHHSVIGGNVWLTKSVPPRSQVYYQREKRD